jgi:DNA-binding XRE family transcriptional regulator
LTIYVITYIFELDKRNIVHQEGEKGMYYILERELKKKKITREMLAKELDISTSTVSCKLNGKNEFTLSECKHILDYLKFNGDIKELFQNA